MHDYSALFGVGGAEGGHQTLTFLPLHLPPALHLPARQQVGHCDVIVRYTVNYKHAACEIIVTTDRLGV